MMAWSQMWFCLLLTAVFSPWSSVNMTKIDLSKIRYHFTPCGSTGHDGPTFSQCEEYYNEHMSPIATDGVLFQFDEEDFQGGQGFRIPREEVYNMTIAGAAGGRGLCNIHFGRGRVMDFQISLTPGYELIVMVGQMGQSPCNNPFDLPLCQSPLKSLAEANQCNQSWYNSTRETDSMSYIFSGGGGGGGASMLRARNAETGYLFPEPIVVAGGGGGTAAILNYNYTVDLLKYHSLFELEAFSLEQLYEYHINARYFNFTDLIYGINGTRGYRPLTPLTDLPGAGGGWFILPIASSRTDGQSLRQAIGFAQGGIDCDRRIMSIASTSEVDGGFGGGGGECGGGGGGGGYTGGAVLGYRNDLPGGGGHSTYFNNSPLTINSESVKYSFNSGDGYVDIVPANCNCSGTCAVNETEDTFECFCPDNTTLAQDGFDCYYETNILINNSLERTNHVGYRLHVLPFLSTPVEIFSIQVGVTVEPGSVCALAFFNEYMDAVAVSAPTSESGSLNLLVKLTFGDSHFSISLSQYTTQLTSSVEAAGAVLITNGDCTLIDATITANISIRSPQSEDINTDFNAMLVNITMIARQILMLPITTSFSSTTKRPQPAKFNMTGLVTGLIAAIVVVLFLLITLAAVIIVSWRKVHRTKIERIAITQAQVMTMGIDEAGAYAKFGPTGATEQGSRYSSLKRLDLVVNSETSSIQYNTLQKQFSSRSINDDGYEVIDYEDRNVVCKLIPTTPSGTVIAPLYGIIAPNHDFTKYNKERGSSGLADWQYPRNKLIYTRELGEGQFGKVLLMKAQGIAGYKGKIPVAVKTLTSRDPSVISKFKEEADLMRKFVHPNIVSLLGVCTDSEDDDDDDNAPLMILEYMPYGDLKGFLENHKPDERGYTCVREKQFQSFAYDIASGLNFLADSHYVHRDVAARNCLVSADLRIKLADFGLSRDIYEKEYYKIGGQTPLPVRWMAPESLVYGIFTTAADVWSYGVVLWEITSYGDAPLDDMEAKDVVMAAQNGTLQHSRPINCPDYIYTLMFKCHTHEASERPTFEDILSILNEQKDNKQ